MRALALACAIFVLPATTRANGATFTKEDAESFGNFFSVLEMLTPDVRVEVRLDDADDGVRWVLSWPLMWTVGTAYFGPDVTHGTMRQVTEDLWFATLQPFIEPQIDVTDDDARLVVGVRSFVGFNVHGPPLVLALEAGGVAGADGRGAFGGAGLSLTRPDGGSLSLLARLVETNEERRVDVVLDVWLAWDWLGVTF